MSTEAELIKLCHATGPGEEAGSVASPASLVATVSKQIL